MTTEELLESIRSSRIGFDWGAGDDRTVVTTVARDASGRVLYVDEVGPVPRVLYPLDLVLVDGVWQQHDRCETP